MKIRNHARTGAGTIRRKGTNMRYMMAMLHTEELLGAARKSRDLALVQEIREQIENGITPDLSWYAFPRDATGKPILDPAWQLQ